MLLVIIFAISFLVRGQYIGGIGRGDISVTLTNIPLSIEKITHYPPAKIYLAQNFPNPFNPSTRIKYSAPQLSNVIIKVFDVLGNEVETLVNEEKPAGIYDVEFNASALPSGVYFYRLQAGPFVETKKMVLFK